MALVKNKILQKILRFVMVVAVVALWTASSDLFAANSASTIMAMAFLTTPVTTKNASETVPDLLRNEIDERIVKIRPSATPIDQISRMGTTRRAGSMKVEYYSVDTKAPSSASIAVAVGVDDNCVNVKVSNPDIFTTSETVLLQNSGVFYTCYVKEITGKLLTLISDQTLPAFPAGTWVVRMGRAAKELDVQSPLYNVLPVKSDNYCQIFKTQVEQSVMQRMADKEVGWTFSDMEEVAIMDMRMGMEKSFLFGHKARLGLENGDEAWCTGGIWNQAGGQVTYNTFDKTALEKLMRAAFTGNAGSTRKIFVAGSDLIESMSLNMGVERFMAADDKETLWGVDFHKLISKFGTLYVVHSEIFDQCGCPGNGMVIDPEYLTKYSHIPFQAERLSLRQSGVRNTDAVVMTEASCLVLRYPKAHLRVVHTTSSSSSAETGD